MSEETAAAPAVEGGASAPAETPAVVDNSPEAAGDETDPDRVEVADEDPDAEPTSEATDKSKADDDTDEIEFNGEKHRIPKALKDAFLMRQDYSKKTETLAQERQTVAAERQALIAQRDQLSEADAEVIAVHAKAHALNEQVTAYQAVDWNTLQANVNAILDPMDRAAAQNELSAAYQQYNLSRDALTAAKEEAKTKEAARLQSHQEAAKAALDKALADTGTALSDPITGIKGWGPQLATTLVQIAAEYGYAQEELTNNPSPRDWKILEDVRALRAENKTLRDAAKTKTTVSNIAKTQIVAPAPVVAAKAPPASGPSDGQGTAGWMERRNAQVAKRARR